MEYNDLFISYRRTHVDFIRQLHDALTSSKRSVWVDWEDILPGSKDFTIDIQQGIEGANAFIPVLTTDYLASEYCLNELNHAISNHKRLLPIVLEEIDERLVPPAINHINWIYFHDHAGNTYKFEESLNKLLNALDVDQDYVSSHTNLQVRAKEWATHDRAGDFVLTGEPLNDAEKFLAAGVSKQPRPTELQADYVIASRTAETKRRQYEQTLQKQARNRLRLSAVLLGITLLLTLGSFVWFYSFTKDVVFKLAQSSLDTMLKTIASGIDGDDLRGLINQARPDGRGGTNDGRYAKELDWLQRMHEIDPRLTAFTYIRTGPHEIAYVADGKRLSDPRRSHSYLEREDRPPDSAIWQVFDGAVTSFEVLSDENGSWLSGYAPIHDSSGQTVGAAGLDMRLDIFLKPVNDLVGVIQVVGVILLCVVVIGVVVFFVVRARQQQALKPA